MRTISVRRLVDFDSIRVLTKPCVHLIANAHTKNAWLLGKFSWSRNPNWQTALHEMMHNLGYGHSQAWQPVRFHSDTLIGKQCGTCVAICVGCGRTRLCFVLPRSTHRRSTTMASLWPCSIPKET